MKIIASAQDMQEFSIASNQAGKTIAFVPTMGNLHDGHISLAKQAKETADIAVVSIYVNPAQFGPNEDFDTYPRTPDADIKKLQSIGIDVVFLPAKPELYPFGNEEYTQVICPRLDTMLCSISRPHFFTGVATVVTKLLNIVQPTKAIFGEKDFQQLLVIKRVCKELFMPVEIIGHPIVRESSGLAMSSRNNYLTDDEKCTAANLFKVLTQAKQDIEAKPAKLSDANYPSSLEEHARIALVEHGFKVDYFEILNAETLTKDIHDSSKSLVIAAACYLNKTRLIDNVYIEL